ncbi:MAG: hypothetical protein V1719_02700 [Patescibacteria group bacterium]
MNKNILLSIIFLFIFSLFVVAKPAIAAVGVSCQSLTISPQKTAYAPRETINVEVIGAGAVKVVNVYYVKTNPDLTSTNPLFWRWDNVNGSYDSVSKSWKGTITLPQQDGEYIITANITDTNGQICSGNPGYVCPGCIKGTEAKTDASGNVIEVGKYSCQGCHKVVVVDSNYGRTSGYNMKKYWNMSPGYSWNYEGENANLGNKNSFNTRFAIEEKVSACGHTILPWRFTKSNSFGYWWPKSPTDPGLSNLRFMLTYFQVGEPWNQNSFGALYHKVYQFPSSATNPIRELGSICPTCRVNLRMFDYQSYGYNYFAPYLYAPNIFVPANYDFERIGANYDSRNEGACSTNYSPTNHNHYWHITYLPDSVDTPAYKGPALRVMQVEAGLIPGSKKPQEGFSWVTREDWYLAENIGIVQIDEYGMWCKDHIADGLCLRTDKKPYELDNSLTQPGVQIKLTSYYTGGPLQITVTPTQVEQTGNYTLHVNNNYTGYLEVKGCISESSCIPTQPFKWKDCNGMPIWVENGIANANLSQCTNLPVGLYHNYFRPWIDTTPADTTGETRLTTTELPWSNEVLIRVGPTPTPLPGNLNGDANGDTKVDGVDSVIWLNHYGQTISGGVAVGDFNKSGKIDGVDYVIWLNNFGK